MIHRLTSLLDDFAEDPMTNQVPFRGQLLFPSPSPVDVDEYSFGATALGG